MSTSLSSRAGTAGTAATGGLSGLTADRVRGDLDVLSRAGLPLETFLEEAAASVARAVPYVAGCIGTHDPVTRMLTSARKYGDLVGRNEQDAIFGEIEYDSGERTTYLDLFRGEQASIGMHLHTDGDVERSERMSRLMLPYYGYADEARLVFKDRDRGLAWGGFALFRGPDDPSFGEGELAFLAGLSDAFARGVRGGMIARVAEVAAYDIGPGVIIVGADGAVLQASPGATAWLTHRGPSHLADPMGVIGALAGAARRVARGDTDVSPRARVRSVDGRWLVLHASPLAGSTDRVGEVVVTIEEARPPEIVALVVEAFHLTPRERDVTQLVLQGVDTKEIAATLHLSAYTVQDHLKSVFEKAGVRSRRELIARIYFDQYVPRMGQELGPSGWFTGAPAPADERRCDYTG